MIRLIDENTVEQYLTYCSDKPFGVRMAAALMSYGTDCSFADFWLVLDDERIVGAASRIDGDMTVCCDGANEELAEFVRVIGGESVTGDKALLLSLGFERFSCEGEIMTYSGDACNVADEEIDLSPSIMTACRLLCECEGDSIRVGQLDRFYTDLCLRVRRGTAKCCLYGDCGVAIASAVTDCAAIIGGVAVRPDKRKMGIGGAVVRGLISALPRGKKIYLLRLDGENEEFYKGLGFTSAGSWASISRGCD